MNKEYIDPDDVTEIINLISDCAPIVIGGQSVNIWARYFSKKHKAFEPINSFVSKDIDFFKNEKAVEKLAANLKNSSVLRPSLDSHLVTNSAIVTGSIGEKRIMIDFMATVLGVDDASIASNSVLIYDSSLQLKNKFQICLMHPIDCLKSRLSNINILGRTNERSIRQAYASIKIVECFTDELLEIDDIKNAQKTLHEIQYIARDRHFGKRSHMEYGDRLDVISILEHFMDDDRLDARWRKLTLGRALNRLYDKLEKYEAPPSALKKEPGCEP